MARADKQFQRASSLQLVGKFHAAYHFFSQAFLSYQSQKDFYGQIQAAHQAGDMARQIEQFSSARSWYTRIFSLLPSWKNSAQNKNQIHSDALCGLALSYRGEGDFTRAVSLLKQTERRYRQQEDHEGVAYTLWAQGTTLRFQGRFGEAERALRQALRLYQALKDPSGLAYASAGLGGTLRMKGRAAESGRLYQKANRTFARLGDKFGLAYTFCGQGNAHRMKNQLKVARVFMNKAIALYTHLGQKGPRGFVLWSRAQTNLLLGDFPSAARDLRTAGKLFSAVQDRRGLVYCELGWGEFWRHQNNTRAKIFFRRAQQKARHLGLPFEAAHALRFLSQSPKRRNFYRKFGIDSKSFFRYRSLP